MKRVITFAVCLFAVVGTLPAALAFVREVVSARPLVCDVYGMPSTVVGQCLTFVQLATWGVE